MTTRVAPQVAITRRSRAASPGHRWEVRFITRGDFHTPQG
jgi:hypothetical protein